MAWAVLPLTPGATYAVAKTRCSLPRCDPKHQCNRQQRTCYLLLGLQRPGNDRQGIGLQSPVHFAKLGGRQRFGPCQADLHAGESVVTVQASGFKIVLTTMFHGTPKPNWGKPWYPTPWGNG